MHADYCARWLKHVGRYEKATRPIQDCRVCGPATFAAHHEAVETLNRRVSTLVAVEPNTPYPRNDMPTNLTPKIVSIP